MDMSLEDRIAASRRNSNRGPRRQSRRGGQNGRDNDNPPSGPRPGNGRARASEHGVTKSTRYSRNSYEATPTTQEWVHDRYESEDDNMYDDQYGSSRDRFQSNRTRRGDDSRDAGDGPVRTSSGRYGYRVNVSNLHEDITEEDLKDVFRQVGGVIEASIIWHRDRSSGCASVIYGTREQALRAAEQFNGQLAMRRTIRVEYDYKAEENSPAAGRLKPKGKLEDRITYPDDDPVVAASKQGIDRYVPPRNRTPAARQSPPSRRPTPIHAGGRAPRGRGAPRQPRGSGSVRPRKTRDELDAEMEDYFGNEKQVGPAEEASAPTTAAAEVFAPAPVQSSTAAPVADDAMELDLEL